MTLRKVYLAAAVLSGAAFGVSAQSANAGGGFDDASVSGHGACVGGRFAGTYIGATIGYAEHEVENKDLIFDTPSFSEDDGSVAGAIHYGYNVQCGRLLVGIESDFGVFDTSVSQVDGTQTLTSEIDWFSTTRLRVGLVHDNHMLFYVTGGLAYADVTHNLRDPFFFEDVYSKTDSDKQWGWTVGGGVELLRESGWSVRAEALYVDLGSESEYYVVEDGPCDGPCEAEYDWDNSFWVARVGLSYKFGAREAEIVPLK